MRRSARTIERAERCEGPRSGHLSGGSMVAMRGARGAIGSSRLALIGRTPTIPSPAASSIRGSCEPCSEGTHAAMAGSMVARSRSCSFGARLGPCATQARKTCAGHAFAEMGRSGPMDVGAAEASRGRRAPACGKTRTRGAVRTAGPAHQVRRSAPKRFMCACRLRHLRREQ